MPAARAPASPGGTKRPGAPSRMTWRKPTLSAQTIGVPEAIASSRTTPKEARMQGAAKTVASR